MYYHVGEVHFYGQSARHIQRTGLPKEDGYTDMLQGTLPVKNKRYQKNVICSGKIEKMGVENRDFPDFLVLLFQK